LRASKIPFRNFDYNIRRAEALARLDGYLEDLLYNEGKGTIKSLFKIPYDIMQAFGIERVMDKTLKRVGMEMKKEFEEEFKEKGKEYFERIAKDYVEHLKPQLRKVVKMFEDLDLLMDQTLLEQALVVGVTAFEVYLQELAASVIMLNPSIRKRFHAEINRMIKLAKLEEYGLDAKRTQGEIVADLIRLDTGNIKSILHRLLNLENVFTDKKTEAKICKIFETRHIIIHQAGFIDPKYKKITKSKSSIDKQITLTRRYVLNSLRTIRQIVERIENHVHRTPK
jgi:hypothetical protein